MLQHYLFTQQRLSSENIFFRIKLIDLGLNRKENMTLSRFSMCGLSIWRFNNHPPSDYLTSKRPLLSQPCFHGFRGHSTISNQKGGTLHASFILHRATFILKFPRFSQSFSLLMPYFLFGSWLDQSPLHTQSCTMFSKRCM